MNRNLAIPETSPPFKVGDHVSRLFTYTDVEHRNAYVNGNKLPLDGVVKNVGKWCFWLVGYEGGFEYYEWGKVNPDLKEVNELLGLPLGSKR